MNRKEKIEQYVKFMEDVAKDNKHGYSQINRWGDDYDCSSLVITALKNAGLNTRDASYTGNMKENLKNDFVNVKKDVNIKTGQGLQRGDILLNESYHVAVYVGNNQMVHARMDEKGGIKGTLKGDQTGQEISITNYYNYYKNWDYVLRLKEEKESIFKKTKININNKDKIIDTIFINNYNYIKLRDLEEILQIYYNKENKTIYIDKK